MSRLAILSLALPWCLVSACTSNRPPTPEPEHRATADPEHRATAAPAPVAPAGPPTSGELIALMKASAIQLEVTPPATLAEHVKRHVPDGNAPPRADCERNPEGGWHCNVWATDAFFYALAVRTGAGGWEIVPDSAEVMPND
jgi:hypothetical protein